MWITRVDWDATQFPPTLEGVLASRIDLLALVTAEILETASVIGRRVLLPLLRAITPNSVDLDEAIEDLIDKGFLEREDDEQVLFHHALVQDIAYSRLLRRVRRELHLKVASAAEELYGSGDDVIDLLARHLYLGEAGTRAIAYLLRAGERAKRLFANQEGIEHFARAVEIARTDPTFLDQLPSVLLDLAELRELVGDYERSFESYREVRETTSDVRALLGPPNNITRQARQRRDVWEYKMVSIDLKRRLFRKVTPPDPGSSVFLVDNLQRPTRSELIGLLSGDPVLSGVGRAATPSSVS